MPPRSRPLTQPDIDSAIGSLRAIADLAGSVACFVGFDGFVDHIIDAVAWRHAPGPDGYRRLPSLSRFAEIVADAAGRSANIELVVRQTRAGGNGPILAGALAGLGARVHAVGALDHPVFDELRGACASCVSVGEPGVTEALEFDDGKLMLGKAAPMDRISWAGIVGASGGIESLVERCGGARVIAPCGWTMVPAMSGIWSGLLTDVLPRLERPGDRVFFVDLSDPAKRSDGDLRAAIGLLQRINVIMPVTLGLNLAEAQRLAGLLPPTDGESRDCPGAIAALADALRRQIGVARVAVHTHTEAAIADVSELVRSKTAHTATPLTSTGAGDHFNAGLCLSLAHGLGAPTALAIAIGVSGIFVRTGTHPAPGDVIRFLQDSASALL
jgi:sugar/nucleoside kinase (ribokinase family)